MSHEFENDDDKVRGVGDLLKEAATAIKLRRYREAEDFAIEALGVLDKASAIEHPSKALALEYMGDCLVGTERLEEAGRFYKRAMDMAEKVHTQESQAFISICYKLARTYESLSLLDECEPYFGLADELAKRHLSRDHPLREAIDDGFAHLISRQRKRREKVVEIMDSFRTTGKEKGASAFVGAEAGEAAQEEEGVEGEDESVVKADAAPVEPARPPAYKGLRQKSAGYEHSTELMTMVISVALLGVGAFCVYYVFQHFAKHAAMPPPKVVEDQKPALTEFVKSYSSLDGKRRLRIAADKRGLANFGPTNFEVKVFEGGDVWKAASETELKNPVKLEYIQSHGNLEDEGGNYLYAEGSPELAVRDAMQSVAKALRNSSLGRGGFPQNADELTQNQITYKNPVTGQFETPIIQVFRGEQGWNRGNPEEKSIFEGNFEAGNLWTNEPPFMPGSVHIFMLAGAPTNDPNVNAHRPSVAIIKGADRNGSPLKIDEDKAFLIVMTPTSERSTPSSSSYPAAPGSSQGAIVTIKAGK